jgi:hypothetical protein
MGLGKRPEATLRPGDRFTRGGEADVVWTVERIIALPKLPPHAVISCQEPACRRILISEVVLRDRRLYQPVAAPAGTDPDRSRSLLARLFGR